METETQKLQKELDKLKEEFNKLSSATTIPLPVDGAFRKRFKIGELVNETTLSEYITTSAKSATSENKVVDEAGTSTYSVLTKPDGFLQIELGGTTYYLPYFT